MTDVNDAASRAIKRQAQYHLAESGAFQLALACKQTGVTLAADAIGYTAEANRLGFLVRMDMKLLLTSTEV